MDISCENDSFYCRPSKKNVLTKLAFATEEIYQLRMEQLAQSRKTVVM